MSTIELNMVVVFKVLIENHWKTLCFTHALKYAIEGYAILAETDDLHEVDYHKCKYICDECKEGNLLK